MGKYDTVVFDLDGTLLNTIEDLTDGVNYVMEQYGYPRWERCDILSFVGNGIRNLMIQATPGGEGNPDFEDIFTCFRTYYTKHCQIKTKAYEGIPELLEKLHGLGYKMAIVSNKTDPAVAELNQLYFNQYISVAIGEKPGVRKKPAPDSVREALQRLGSKKEHAVYVGDSEVDAKTAENAEMDCILVTWGFREKAKMEVYHPMAFIDKPMELVDILES